MITDSGAPIRIFVGSSAKNRIEEKVLIRSLRRRSELPLEINIIDGNGGLVHMHDGSVMRLPREISVGIKGATAFSLARFAIPEWCGYRGRAIYLDSDQLAFENPAALWRWNLQGATAAAVAVREAHCAPAYWEDFLQKLASTHAAYFLASVMVIECSEASSWSIANIHSSVVSGRLGYSETMFLGPHFRSAFATSVTPLDPAWNCLDCAPPGAKLVHFTDLKSQPWLFPHNPLADTWEREYFDTVDCGEITRGDLDAARVGRGISVRVRAMAGFAKAIRPAANHAWRAVEQVLWQP